jgi:hypothetical protein
MTAAKKKMQSPATPPATRGVRGPKPNALTTSIPLAGALLGRSLNASYELAKRGEIPTVVSNRVSKAWLAETLCVPLDIIDARLAWIEAARRIPGEVVAHQGAV